MTPPLAKARVRTAAVKMIKVFLKREVRGDRLGETRAADGVDGQVQVQVQVAKSQKRPRAEIGSRYRRS
jgi:hypothetical protein